MLDVPTAEADACSSNLTSLSVKAHGISLYQEFPQLFWNSYKPYVYGGLNVVTPADCGAAMINFSQYPRTYQPSGHLNVSRARELKMIDSVVGQPMASLD